MPATVEALKVHLGLSTVRPVDEQAMGMAVDAANSMVLAFRSDLGASTVAARAQIALAYWESSTGTGLAQPANGKYLTDAEPSPAGLAFANTDADGLAQHDALMSLTAGDALDIANPNNPQDWRSFVVGSPVDHATWVELPVTADTQGPAYVLPGGNRRMLFAFSRESATPGAWPARADEAAVIQAARLYGRRGSVVGVAAYQDVGVTLLARLDPDVRALLQLGEYQDSVVA